MIHVTINRIWDIECTADSAPMALTNVYSDILTADSAV